MERLNKFCGIIFGYRINTYSDHKNLVHSKNQSEYQIVMRWWLILKYFEPNIQHINVVDNMVADTISRLTYTTIDLDEPITNRARIWANELFATRVEQTVDDRYPLYLASV